MYMLSVKGAAVHDTVSLQAGGVRGMVDGPGAQERLGGAEQPLHLQQVPVAVIRTGALGEWPPSPGLQRRDRHPEHLGNLPLTQQPIILRKCSELHFSMVCAREHAAGRSNFRSNRV
jgi:hypothetical protein